MKQVAENLPQATPENIQNKKANTQVDFLTQTDSLAQFNAEVEKANQALNAAGAATVVAVGYFKQLSPAMYEAAKAAQQNGASNQTLATVFGTLVPQIQALNDRMVTAANLFGNGAAQVDAIQSSLITLASSSATGASAAQALISAYSDQKITIDQLEVALRNLLASEAVIAQQTAITTTAQGLAAQREGERTAGIKQLTDAQIEQSTAIADAITKEQAQQQQEELLKQVKEELARLAPQVAAGILTVGEAAAIAAGKFNIEEAAIRGVIAAEADLARIKGLKEQQNNATRDAGTGKFGGPERTMRGSQTNRGTDQQRLDAIIAQQKANEELAQSERDLAEARGGNETKLANLRKDLAGLTAGTAEYNKKLTEIVNLENQMAKQNNGGARLSAQEKLNNSLLNAQDKTNDKLENAEREHQQRMVDIIEEFEAKQLASQKKNEVDKRASRASFYESLIAEEKINQQKYSAEYEKAFEESQKLAMSGQQELANEYLAMRQKQIQDDIEFEKKRKAIEEDKDLSKKEKEARLKALDEIDKLRKEQQQEELKQLLEGGDANVNALNEKLNAEAERYNEQTGKIKTIAEQQADARIAAWERANKTIAGQPPAELTNFTNAGVPVPQTTQPTQPEQPATAPTGSASDPIVADTTITDSQIMQVAVTGLAMVRDEGVIAEISALASRLESKLGELMASTEAQGGKISDKLDGVKEAIKNIKVKLVNP